MSRQSGTEPAFRDPSPTYRQADARWSNRPQDVLAARRRLGQLGLTERHADEFLDWLATVYGIRRIGAWMQSKEDDYILLLARENVIGELQAANRPQRPFRA